jgi:AraC-like DNA-binding protein
LGSAAVTESRLDGFVAERDQALIHATGADHVLLVAVFEGSVRFEAEGVDAACGPGDAFVCDFTRPNRMTTAGVYCATVAMPRLFVDVALDEIVLHGPLPRGASSQVLVETLRTLVRELPRMPRASALFYARVLRDLLAAAASGMPRQPRPGDTSRRALGIAYVETQPPGQVSVAGAMAALGMTRSTLYRLFQADGGLMAYDRVRRLRALHRDLADPLERRTVAELGAAHGFLDRAHLARLFRATFGYSMTTLRRRIDALGQAAPDPEEQLPERLRDAVRKMAAT